MRHDPARLQTLKSLLVLDTAPEVVYDDLTRALAQTLDVPIAMVNLLDDQRDWFKSCLGLPMTESPAETSFCEIFFNSTDDVIVVEDTTLDKRFDQHPLVVGPPHIRFYAAARLSIKGNTVGTLCAYDLKPKQVPAESIATLKMLARAAMDSLAKRLAA